VQPFLHTINVSGMPSSHDLFSCLMGAWPGMTVSMEDDAWYYNENINISFIKIFDISPSIVIKVEYPHPQAPWYYTNRFLWKLAMQRSHPGN
jgi:hypothetical protein